VEAIAAAILELAAVVAEAARVEGVLLAGAELIGVQEDALPVAALAALVAEVALLRARTTPGQHSQFGPPDGD
jgi:hypothetical protein